ncbi:glycoprotein-N-acetylgalactosamine 3-beta-galactosyltransferase 1-like isoform X1 [Biomphalaria glabrata]|uniref:Glycoprotein-N-acetylgalactosamine 3-beta-galactosyltransferase 1 n=1 Tax=Biomphalaria glabrata TaxID=6526 RepID=A0A9U8E9C9_BIOGL|nr:glycoprotein-N-acetylgalactosamine 3-beta-galactosyltransferase 1-like isoform X1 [Biomphalaria glabrata]
MHFFARNYLQILLFGFVLICTFYGWRKLGYSLLQGMFDARSPSAIIDNDKLMKWQLEGKVHRELGGDRHDNTIVSRKPKDKVKVKVLVWVMTSPMNLQTKAKAVKETWGKHCDKVIFFSSETDQNFPTIGLNVSEGRNHLTAKTMQGFRYVYDHFFNDFDWFMKADDDTYVIPENLRYFLSDQNTSKPIFFGHYFKNIVKQGYFSGGGGYVLSKEALRRFGERGKDPKLCRQDGGAEDVEIGICMQNFGVKAGNSTDALGRTRFHCLTPEVHLLGPYPKWYFEYVGKHAKWGTESISDYAISFHYVDPKKMYMLEFYLYHLRLSEQQKLIENKR